MRSMRVLVVGGGFGGVRVARDLAEMKQVSVTLLTDQTDFRYYPTLYHTATGGMRKQSSIPLTKLLWNTGINLEYGVAEMLDRTKKAIVTSDGRRFEFDRLVLALGSVTNYFNIPGMEEHSFNIKSIEGVAAFKQHVHQQMSETGKPDSHYVVVGGGATGVELSGALPEYLRSVMKRHGISRGAIHVDLVEAGPRLLPRSHPAISKAVRARLHDLGVKLYTDQRVQGATADSLNLNGKPLSTHTVVWTAGVSNHPFFSRNNFALNPRGKVTVDQHLQAEPHIFVIGDNADTPYSGLAQTALVDAGYVSRAIAHQAQERPLNAYKPKRPISVIPVGARWAAIEWGSLHYAGHPGWLLRQAADWVGFHDLSDSAVESTKQWMTEFGRQEEDCTICATSRSTA